MLKTLFAAGLLLLAQGDPEPLRSRLRGTVRLSDGSPWAGARVVLVSGFSGDLVGGLPSDVREVRSDARGRFEALARPGRAYSVWALGEARDGRYACSEVVEGAHAGDIVRLAESGAGRRRVVVKLAHRERWRDREPLRFQVITTTKNPLVLDVEPDDSGTVLLPLLPGAECLWRGLGKDGSPVMMASVSLEGGPDGPGPRTQTLEFPERFPWLVKVVDRTDKKGVANVSVYQRFSHLGQVTQWTFAGTTDEKGFAPLLLTRLQGATAQAQQHVLLRVQGKGCAMQQFGRSVAFEKDRDLQKLIAADKPDYTMQVYGETARVTGRVLIRKGRPAARRKLIFYPSFGNPKSRSFYFNVEPVIVETDAEGRFETTGWGPRFAYRICVLADDEIAAALPRSETHPTSPTVLLALGITEGETDLGELVLDELKPVDVSARRADGFPAAGGEVLLAESGSGIEFKNSGGQVERVQLYCYKAIRASLGRRGRLRLLVPDTGYLHLGVILDGAWALQKLEPASGAPVSVVLSQPTLLTGRVINASGKPVPGATVQANPMRYPRGFDSRLANLFTQRFVTADADGRFRLGLPFKDTSYYIWARIQVGGRWYNTQHQNVIDVEREGRVPEQIELEVPIPDAELGGKKEGEAVEGGKKR